MFYNSILNDEWNSAVSRIGSPATYRELSESALATYQNRIHKLAYTVSIYGFDDLEIDPAFYARVQAEICVRLKNVAVGLVALHGQKIHDSKLDSLSGVPRTVENPNSIPLAIAEARAIGEALANFSKPIGFTLPSDPPVHANPENPTPRHHMTETDWGLNALQAAQELQLLEHRFLEAAFDTIPIENDDLADIALSYREKLGEYLAMHLFHRIEFDVPNEHDTAPPRIDPADKPASDLVKPTADALLEIMDLLCIADDLPDVTENFIPGMNSALNKLRDALQHEDIGVYGPVHLDKIVGILEEGLHCSLEGADVSDDEPEPLRNVMLWMIDQKFGGIDFNKG